MNETKVFVFDSRARPVLSFPVNHGGGILANGNDRQLSSPTQHCHVTCVAVGMNDDILVGGSGVQMYDSAGKFVRTISLFAMTGPATTGNGNSNRSSAILSGGSPSAPVEQALVGGLAVDRWDTGTVLAAVMDKNRTYLSVSRYKGDAAFPIDSFGAKLKRPSGICITSDKQHCLVADLGNHCIKKFRFK